MSRRFCVPAALLALLAASRAAARQGAVDLVPVIGLYLATTEVYEWSDREGGVTATLSGKHKTGSPWVGA